MNIDFKYGLIQGKLSSVLDQLADICYEEKLELLAEYAALQTEIDNRYIEYLQQENERQQYGYLAEINNGINDLKTMINPVNKFFSSTDVAEDKKRVSAKEKKRLAEEEHEKRMDLKALAYLNKKGDKSPYS